MYVEEMYVEDLSVEYTAIERSCMALHLLEIFSAFKYL